jgi:peptidoglycan hydrolase CwlO-like protein
MIDKKISVGTLITIVTIGGTVIFTQGATSHRIESVEKEAFENTESIKSVVKEINQNKVDIGKIEAKIDEGFKRIETLFIEN